MLFAGFYIEANLKNIVRVLKLKRRVRDFMGCRKHPGLGDKLAWFYNDFISLVREEKEGQAAFLRLGRGQTPRVARGRVSVPKLDRNA